MLSSALKSKRAVHVNTAIMRAFVKLREVIGGHKDLALKIDELERKYKKHDKAPQVVFETIRDLLKPPATGLRRPIGFGT